MGINKKFPQTKFILSHWNIVMPFISSRNSTPQHLAMSAVMMFVTLITWSRSQSAVGHERLAQPLPRTALNGAIHYQRAILFLTAVDPAKRAVLQKPMWEIITTDMIEEELAPLNELLIESRHAIRSALVGSNQAVADFGLDLRQYMVSSLLPHNQSMVDLAKLITLHGMQRESAGQWKEAAEIYFATLRIGRHMTHQTTLAEAFVGVEILETAYFALGYWATNCPDAALVEEALDLLAATSIGIVQPARTMQSEANILKMRIETLQNAYPEGAWAEMLLEVFNADIPSADPEGLRKAAIQVAIDRGLPREAFDSKEAFVSYTNNLSSVYLDMLNESVLCLSRSAPESIRCGEAVAQKYKQKLIETKNTNAWKPAKIASLFAVHEAELAVLRTSMAIAAARSAGVYPASLEDIVDKFDRQMPTSPYDGSPLVYQVLEDGKGFSLTVSKAKVGNVELPAINFVHRPKEAK